jgi:hypothetical protein
MLFLQTFARENLHLHIGLLLYTTKLPTETTSLVSKKLVKQIWHLEAAAEFLTKEARELSLHRLEIYNNTRSIDAREEERLRVGTASPATLHTFTTGARAR